MTILGENLDYTDRDFDSLRTRLYNLISSAFPTWTTRQIADFGNILIELFCFVGDVLGKYQDNQAAESRWSTATQRKNLIALAKAFNYEPATATAAQADVTISIPSAISSPVPIPAGTIVRTASNTDRIEYQTLSLGTITPGTTNVNVTAENSETQSEIYTSQETPNYSITLGSTPYIDDTLSLSAGNGVYSEVSSFLDSDSTDLHYTVTVDQNDKATVRFGDGINGAIPTGTITAIYKTGGGAAGYVEAGAISVIEGNFFADDGTPVTLSVTNASASSEATDRESTSRMNQLMPLANRVLNRTVSKEDYEINAKRISGVIKTLLLTSDEDISIGENSGILYVVPTGGGLPTTLLKNAVNTMVTETYENTLTFSLVVSDPVYKDINVYAEIYVNDAYSPTDVKASIESNLETFFSAENSDGTENEDIGFGYDYIESSGASYGNFPYSDIYNVVRDTIGVDKIKASTSSFLLNSELSDVQLLLREFPRLGTVTIINAATGTPI